MTDIPIPGGPTNKDLIDLAYLALGVSDAMFGRTEEEYASAQKLLRAMMGEYPFDRINYDATNDHPSERSGIPFEYEQAVALCLAERLGPAISKSLTAEARARKARSFSMLCAAANVTPSLEYAQGTPSGAGNKRRLGSPFAYDAS